MSKNLNVLFILNLPAPYRVDFLNRLNKDMDVMVFFEKSISEDRNLKWFQDSDIKFNYSVLNENKKNIFMYLKSLRKADLVVVGGYSTPLSMMSIMYLNLINKSFILNADGGFIKKDKYFIKKIKKYFISSADNWLSTGKITNEYLLNYGAKKSNIYIYPFSSVSEREIYPVTEEDKLELKKSLNMQPGINILFVGSFIYRKNVELLLEASLIVKSANFHIIGGVATEKYKEIVNNSNNVHFYEHMSKNELKKYYDACDIFVFPTREDIWGLVINEALAHGLPIITTDKCIAGTEMIKDSTHGTIISTDSNSEKLANAILELINNLTFYNRKRLQETAKSYTIEKMVTKHIEIFNTIINKKNNYRSKK